MSHRILGISLEKEMWEQIDAIRQDVSRSKFVSRCVEAHLKVLKKD